MIYPDELSDSESAKVLEGFDVAESRHWIEQLDWSWWQSFRNENQETHSEGTMQLTTTPLATRSQGREMGLLCSSCVCSGQKLPSTKNCWFPLSEVLPLCFTQGTLYSPPPSAPLASPLTAESLALQNSPMQSAKPET